MPSTHKHIMAPAIDATPDTTVDDGSQMIDDPNPKSSADIAISKNVVEKSYQLNTRAARSKLTFPNQLITIDTCC